MREILPVLLILVCPLLMLFMMRGMHGGSRGHDHTAPLPRPDPLEERIRELELRLAELEEAEPSATGGVLTRR
ncbi:MAG: DUF2933 domain-containing protein [Thermoleophilia bacterium]